MLSGSDAYENNLACATRIGGDSKICHDKHKGVTAQSYLGPHKLLNRSGGND